MSEPTEKTLPEWPFDPPLECDNGYDDFDWEGWHADRAEAALARLKVAVEALRLIEALDEPSSFDAESIAMQALTAIGPLPEA